MGQPTEFVLVPFSFFDLSVGQKLSPRYSFKNHCESNCYIRVFNWYILSRWFSTEYSLIDHIRVRINTSVEFL